MPQYRMATAAPASWGRVGCSNRNMKTVDSAAVTKNSTKLSCTPSSWGPKCPTSRICSANNSAQSSSSHSPPVRLRVSRPARQSRYSPATLTATQTHSRAPGRRPASSPSTGTITTYSAVKNPALAVLVVPTPICWAAEAANSAAPHSSPPSASFLGASQKGTRSPRRRCPARRTASSPSRNAQASQLRAARKV